MIETELIKSMVGSWQSLLLRILVMLKQLTPDKASCFLLWNHTVLSPLAFYHYPVIIKPIWDALSPDTSWRWVQNASVRISSSTAMQWHTWKVRTLFLMWHWSFGGCSVSKLEEVLQSICTGKGKHCKCGRLCFWKWHSLSPGPLCISQRFPSPMDGLHPHFRLRSLCTDMF